MTNRYHFHRVRAHTHRFLKNLYVLFRLFHSFHRSVKWAACSACIVVHHFITIIHPSVHDAVFSLSILFFAAVLVMQLPDLAHSPSTTSSSANDFCEKRTAGYVRYTPHSGKIAADQKTSLFRIIF